MGLKLLALLAACSAASGSAPRRVRISGRAFEVASSGAPIVLAGPNVVVKGPPYLPSTAGDSVCSDVVTDLCAAHGNCSSCTTFTALDAQNFAQRGWNALRLGIVWAGAQPRDEDALDPAFVARLHAVLALTDAHNLTVVLDNHGDMVGSAGCGNGMPMWFQQRAAPELIGAPLATGFPFDLIPSLQVDALVPQACKANASLWRVASGDPQYNLLNPCCREMNAGGNPGALGYTTVSQKSMDYMITPGPGRDAFVRYWRLVAEAVTEHPSASFAELMNEPMTIWREQAFDTWRAAGEAILAVVPDMGISVCVRARALLPAAAAPAHNAHTPLIPPPPSPFFSPPHSMDLGEGVLLPDWLSNITGGSADISPATLSWIKHSGSVFYAWHWYSVPATAAEAVAYVQALGAEWGIPTFATEFMDCAAWKAAAAAGISHLYWHYSAYCNTGASFANTPTHDTFGACILGWAGGTSNYTCS